MALAISLGSYAMAQSVLKGPPGHPQADLAHRVVQRFSENIEAVNTHLKQHGIRLHVEPDVVEKPLVARVDFRIAYSAVGQLCDLAIAVNADRTGLVDREMASNHLVHHSDSEGLYVPIDFASPVAGDGIPGNIVGSSQGLLRDLGALAPKLNIPLEDGVVDDDAFERIRLEANVLGAPYPAERMAWLVLFDAARLSVEHGMAIVYS